MLHSFALFGKLFVVDAVRWEVHLCDELAGTTGLLDLLLGVLGEVAGADNDWDLWETTLAKDLAVAEGEEVEDWSGVGGLVGEELLALLSWDERPELEQESQ